MTQMRLEVEIRRLMTRLKPLSIATLALGGSIPMFAQSQVTLTVNANMDIYRAGAYNDGSDGVAPVVYSFPARALQTLTFASVSGMWTCTPSVPAFGPDGTTKGCMYGGLTTQHINNPVGTFSGYGSTDFIGGMVGIFLENTLPTSAPAPLQFYVGNSSDGGIQTDFKNLSPKIGQVFFIGDGLTGTGSGAVQVFSVPAAATHLYLGYVDSCNNTVPGCYSDNSGSLTAIFQLNQYVLDWVEPRLSSAPSARCCSGIAYDAAHFYTLLFGGGSAGQPNPAPKNDTWVWHSGWRQLSPATSPSPRNGPNLVYDPTPGTVVLFGGQGASGNDPNDTWTWDGVTWTQQFPAVSPPGRELDVPGMAYDAVTQTVILFGGSGEGGALGDTWEWDGQTKTWTELFPAASPSPRIGTSLAYDAITREIVLFGGNGSTGDLNDTWTWNGATWTQRFPAASPSPRQVSSIAYYASLGQVVLFGGRAPDGQSLDDTWGWNGIAWTQLKLPAQPPARYTGAMDFDPFSDGLVLFAGWLECCTPLDDTWLLAPVLAR